jgi:L-iditol 2-dehydrogenase
MRHSLELVKIRVGDTVAIVGAGPIGMLCARTAKISGASKVFICDRVPHRVGLAKRMGADVAVDVKDMGQAVLDGTKGRGVDIAFDAAGMVETINLAIALARQGATVTMVGISPHTHLALDVWTAMAKELTLQTVKRSNHKGEDAARLLSSGVFSDVLITHRMPLDATPRAFQMLTDYSDGVGKVVIEL